MKILLTAFVPFGSRNVNASQVVLESISDQIYGWETKKYCLPVESNTAPDLAIQYIDNEQPDFVVSLGEAGGIDWLQLEFVAINWMDFRIPDNANLTVSDTKIQPDGETAYFSSLPLRKISSQLSEQEIPNRISMSAGTFLCNQVFYNIMNHVTRKKPAIPAGFIHIPASIVGGESTEITCDLQKCQEGILTILKALID